MRCQKCKAFVDEGKRLCPSCGFDVISGRKATGPVPVPTRRPPPYAQQPAYMQPILAQPPNQPMYYPPPPYPPPGYQPPPSPPGPAPPGLQRRYEPMKETTTMKIALVVFFIVVMVMILTTFFWFVGVGSEPENPVRVTVNIAVPDVQMRPIDGIDHWDALLNINKITPRDENVRWSTVAIVVISATGSTLDGPIAMRQDWGGPYDDYSDGWVTVEFWFVETTGDVRMSASDGIRMTGLSRDYEGATIRLLRAGDTIGVIMLPLNFP